MGTASEQSLRNILTELESDTLPTGAATAANQTTMITALQLIDDLRNALATVATDKLRASVIDSVLPTDAATETTVDLCLTELEDVPKHTNFDIHPVTKHLGVAVDESVLPTDAATQTTLASCLTALQLIDDLRAALHSVNTDELQVNVETMPTTTVQNAAPGSLQCAPSGWDGTSLYLPVRVDDLGHLQVDVLTTALPTDAATQTTLAAILAAQVNRATTPVIYNVTMTTAATEYSQALPANTKRFLIKCRTSYDIKVCFTVNLSGTTYLTVPAGMSYYEDLIQPAAITLYFQCATAAQVAEIVAWS